MAETKIRAVNKDVVPMNICLKLCVQQRSFRSLCGLEYLIAALH